MIAKKVCLQKRICHRLALSNDLTIKPPKLKQKAPKKTSIGPGIILINFIQFYS
jgi:hypothetical protein